MKDQTIVRLPRRPAIFAAPRPAASPGDGDSLAEIADRVGREVRDFRARYDRRLDDLELRFGRQGLGAGAGDVDPQARRLDIFNATLRERHGAGAGSGSV